MPGPQVQAKSKVNMQGSRSPCHSPLCPLSLFACCTCTYRPGKEYTCLPLGHHVPCHSLYAPEKLSSTCLLCKKHTSNASKQHSAPSPLPDLRSQGRPWVPTVAAD
eukprot:scaffold138015_cov23-Tisochrysis_lutea.AAC.3